MTAALATVDGPERAVTFRCAGSLCRVRQAPLVDAAGRPQLETLWWPFKPPRMLPDDQAQFENEMARARLWILGTT